ncbi:hypothetical protein ACFQXB_03670 [Plastorhodobacter daqingensis]|uniref:HIG1 domain-containing protein n=1 Tax=Plastorhodobacter daqingensis TaxID=1387281 RepID=A0ABW2UH17_9RHOB
MEWLIWTGAAAALLGVAGLIWCVVLALGLRKSSLPEDEQRRRLQRVVIINMSALGLSALGLVLVVAGIILG